MYSDKVSFMASTEYQFALSSGFTRIHFLWYDFFHKTQNWLCYVRCLKFSRGTVSLFLLKWRKQRHSDRVHVFVFCKQYMFHSTFNSSKIVWTGWGGESLSLACPKGGSVEFYNGVRKHDNLFNPPFIFFFLLFLSSYRAASYMPLLFYI